MDGAVALSRRKLGSIADSYLYNGRGAVVVRDGRVLADYFVMLKGEKGLVAPEYLADEQLHARLCRLKLIAEVFKLLDAGYDRTGLG